jgi:hypothetical protein
MTAIKLKNLWPSYTLIDTGSNRETARNGRNSNSEIPEQKDRYVEHHT